MKKIAILGITGNIGKALTHEFTLHDGLELFLFSRSKERAGEFIKSIDAEGKCSIHLYDEFNDHEYDVVVNCAGIGNPAILKKAPEEIFKVTEFFDALIMGYIEKRPSTFYINLSSGAVYGQSTNEAIVGETQSVFNVKNLAPTDYYAVAKLNSEAKHRAAPHLNIVDFRTFSTFSRFADTESKFFMSDVLKAIKEGSVLEVPAEDMERDYLCAADFFNLIEAATKKEKLNDYFDVYSSAPASKFEILDMCTEKFGLRYEIKEGSAGPESPTGQKRSYFSKDRKAGALGYVPKFSSLAGIEEELRHI